MKNVQIPEEFFRQLVLYHLLNEDDFEEEIKSGLEEKLNAIARRTYYAASKTAPTPEERETARQAYLDEVGYRDSYRY